SPALVNDAPTTTSPAGVPSPSIEAEPVGIEIRPEGRPADAMRDALRAAEARAATVLGHEPRAEAAREQGTESASAGSPAPTAAAERLREVQRAYDAHIERADRAAEAADPLRTRATKDAAQRAFRAERDRATTRNELEAAARAWLVEINRINAEVRAGSAAST